MSHSSLALLQRAPHRISFTIPDSVLQRLVDCSTEQGRSLSNLCAYLVEQALDRLMTSTISTGIG